VRKIGFKTLLIAITLLSSSATPISPDFKVDIVVIDPGHGGRDPGTHGEFMNEKDVTLKISLKVGSYI
jgi:N-acetylmuramoyl-L-alanine amidase